MKIWHGYGSEHSMNLVMIGQFKDMGDAAKAKALIEQITAQVNADVAAKRLEIGERADRYSDEMSELLRGLNMFILAPGEMEQFAYDTAIDAEDDRIVIKTDEADVSALLKILIDCGARVEVYSAHHYPISESGRGS